MVNREILVVGYGSLLSGYGLLAERRGGASRLVARDVHPVVIHNARRGLAKPSSHGKYLAMDIEPIERSAPISASIAAEDSANGIGGLLLTFARDCAPLIARREEYDPDAFERLIGIAERDGQPLGEYLIEIARATNFDLLEYRIKLRAMLDYTWKLTTTPWLIDDADRTTLRDTGLTEHDIFDLSETVAFFNLSNRMASATDMMPNREYHKSAR